MRLPLVALSTLFFVACSSSETTPPATTADSATAADVATNDAATTEDTATAADSATTETATGSCDFVGSWSLETIACGAMDITSSWKAIIPTTDYVITAGSAGCHIELTNQSAACTEKMSFDWIIATDGNLTSGSSAGITSCEPASCKFNSSDAACVVGDRASTSLPTGETATMKKEGGKLVLVINKSGDICQGAAQRQTFVAK